MKRVIVALLFLVCAGCEDELKPASIWIDVSPVNLGVHSTAEDAGPYHFDLQLINIGEEKLVLESVEYRGDQNCAFTFEGPDVWEMNANQSSFVRGWYEPTVPAEDQIAMTVMSNADNYPELIVPICGLAVPPETEDAVPIECQVPPDDQPNCESP
jgi:hypothetical protein